MLYIYITSLKVYKVCLCVKWALLSLFCFVLFCFVLRFYSFERDRMSERENMSGEREKQASCGEPYVGLDPRTPGSCPELKIDA